MIKLKNKIIVSTKEFDRLFDELDKDADCISFDEYIQRLDELDKTYIVFGLRPIVNGIRRVISKWRNK